MEAIGDYYATLRVEPNADNAALRRAYRALMRRYHPDVNLEGDAADHCQAINEAYACLRDPSKRAAYDAKRRAQVSSRRPAVTLSPQAYHPTWGAHHAEQSVRDAATQSRGGKAAIIGAAILLTIITFAVTSGIDTRGSRQADAAEEPTWVKLKVDPDRQGPKQ